MRSMALMALLVALGPAANVAAESVCSGHILTPGQIAACLGGGAVGNRPGGDSSRSWGAARGVQVDRGERNNEVRRVELEVNFSFARDDLSNDAQISLRNIAEFLMSAPNEVVRLQIIGHTDGLGSDAVNQNLSERRAERVRAYLISVGIAEDRLRATGRGRRELKRPDQPTAAENRRVEFQVLPE